MINMNKTTLSMVKMAKKAKEIPYKTILTSQK